MSDTTHNLTLDILKQVQTGFAEMRSQFAEVTARLDRLEDTTRKHRRNSAGMLVMMQATAGDFDERVNVVEERMDALEGRIS